MATASYHHADTVHAAAERPRLVWGRLAALAFAIGSWAAIIASVRAIF